MLSCMEQNWTRWNEAGPNWSDRQLPPTDMPPPTVSTKTVEVRSGAASEILEEE